MPQRLRVHTAFAKDPSTVPSTHVGWFTITCNSSFRVSDAPYWSLRVPALLCAHPISLVKKKKKKNLQRHLNSSFRQEASYRGEPSLAFVNPFNINRKESFLIYPPFPSSISSAV